MKIVELKCPNCGAPVPRATLRCKYCGANLVLVLDGALKIRGAKICPKCGTQQAEGSWLCINCGFVLTEDIAPLKELQRKIRFDQERTIKLLPKDLQDKIEIDEFIHYAFKRPALLPGFYIVSEKKLIKYEKGLFRSDYKEIQWSDVVTVSEPEISIDMYAVTAGTFHGDVIFLFMPEDLRKAVRFYEACHEALNNYTFKKRDVRALICFLNFEDKEQQKP